jgi:mRNA (2'-O-methyladenosine-N6-)-methyltransferase
VIFSERRGQSQKPEELYEMIEELVPNGTFLDVALNLVSCHNQSLLFHLLGRYLEIFGRKNNLRDYWVTVGNEL